MIKTYRAVLGISRTQTPPWIFVDMTKGWRHNPQPAGAPPYLMCFPILRKDGEIYSFDYVIDYLSGFYQNGSGVGKFGPIFSRSQSIRGVLSVLEDEAQGFMRELLRKRVVPEESGRIEGILCAEDMLRRFGDESVLPRPNKKREFPIKTVSFKADNGYAEMTGRRGDAIRRSIYNPAKHVPAVRGRYPK